jgi:hypothetical protein
VRRSLRDPTGFRPAATKLPTENCPGDLVIELIFFWKEASAGKAGIIQSLSAA